jgi:hypothetical protein
MYGGELFCKNNKRSLSKEIPYFHMNKNCSFKIIPIAGPNLKSQDFSLHTHFDFLGLF